MYERKHKPLLSMRQFLIRVLCHALLAVAVILGSLWVGVLGYHMLEGLGYLDSFLNASMILGGMGPVDTLHTAGGKFFAGCYALYSGLVVLVVAGVLGAPWIHRLLHHFHLEVAEKDNDK